MESGNKTNVQYIDLFGKTDPTWDQLTDFDVSVPQHQCWTTVSPLNLWGRSLLFSLLITHGVPWLFFAGNQHM